MCDIDYNSLDIISQAEEEAAERVADVREAADRLGECLCSRLHFVSPEWLAEIKRRLRKFDAVKHQWK